MVIDSHLCVRMPFGEDGNGRESCWGNLGGSVVEQLQPLGAEKWYGEYNKFDTSRRSRSMGWGILYLIWENLCDERGDAWAGALMSWGEII